MLTTSEFLAAGAIGILLLFFGEALATLFGWLVFSALTLGRIRWQGPTHRDLKFPWHGVARDAKGQLVLEEYTATPCGNTGIPCSSSGIRRVEGRRICLKQLKGLEFRSARIAPGAPSLTGRSTRTACAARLRRLAWPPVNSNVRP